MFINASLPALNIRFSAERRKKAKGANKLAREGIEDSLPTAKLSVKDFHTLVRALKFEKIDSATHVGQEISHRLSIILHALRAAQNGDDGTISSAHAVLKQLHLKGKNIIFPTVKQMSKLLAPKRKQTGSISYVDRGFHFLQWMISGLRPVSGGRIILFTEDLAQTDKANARASVDLSGISYLDAALGSVMRYIKRHQRGRRLKDNGDFRKPLYVTTHEVASRLSETHANGTLDAALGLLRCFNLAELRKDPRTHAGRKLAVVRPLDETQLPPALLAVRKPQTLTDVVARRLARQLKNRDFVPSKRADRALELRPGLYQALIVSPEYELAGAATVAGAISRVKARQSRSGTPK